MSRLVKWALIGFLVFYVCTDPSGAGATAHHMLNGIHQAATSLAKFVNTL
jgi:hypothetical protein